ncbi:deoxynucleoside kinase [Luminiphilus sp.]|nr:deoxynucleoside kinase [Luminiphilus sp.]MDB2643302.1 deoxynucleoside kinase [Luminiphilus sp.]
MLERSPSSGLALRGRTVPAFIAIEGPIGVGKTTLARKIAETFEYDLLLEEAEMNPFLERFYQNREQTALATQLFFLFQRVQKITDIKQRDMFERTRVTDFILEKDPLFARVNLEPAEYALYDKVYEKMQVESPTPDLVIYLQANPERLLERIGKRGIDAEQSIDRLYLEQLNEVYSEFFLYYDAAPLLIVNANDIDLAESDRDYEQLVDYMLNIKKGRHYFNPTFFS